MRLALCALVFAPTLVAQDFPTDSDLTELLGDRWTVEAEVYSLVGPAVVGIDLNAEIHLRDFFGRIQSSKGSVGQGTGVVIDSAGLIITNAHVAAPEVQGLVEGSMKITVSFAEEFGGKKYSATVLNVDRQWDLALLKIDEDGPFHSVPLGQSATMMKGEKVIAIGTPYGNDHSITSGILSGIHRNIQVRTSQGAKKMPGLLQTDAAINPGNSGGPLLNAHGELVGINVATMDAADGIGFAIPADRVIETLGERLLDVDRSDRFWAGMRVEHGNHGLQVVSTHPRGPAALAGIQAGDQILKIDQGEVSGISDYAALMLPKQAGDSVKIRIASRTGLEKNIDLKLGAARLRDTLGLLGFDAQRDQVQFRNRAGRRQRMQALRVTKIYPQSGAENLGLEIGDLIVGILIRDGKADEVWEPVRSTSELVSLVRGPSFVLAKDNFWILRGESSFRGRLLFDSPEMKLRN